MLSPGPGIELRPSGPEFYPLTTRPSRLDDNNKLNNTEHNKVMYRLCINLYSYRLEPPTKYVAL